MTEKEFLEECEKNGLENTVSEYILCGWDKATCSICRIYTLDGMYELVRECVAKEEWEYARDVLNAIYTNPIHELYLEDDDNCFYPIDESELADYMENGKNHIIESIIDDFSE